VFSQWNVIAKMPKLPLLIAQKFISTHDSRRCGAEILGALGPRHSMGIARLVGIGDLHPIPIYVNDFSIHTSFLYLLQRRERDSLAKVSFGWNNDLNMHKVLQ
jgi:hypothetical protein